MRVLVIGQGGREHAICHSLVAGESVEQVFALPGNPGMAPDVTLLTGSVDVESVVQHIQAQSIDLTIIGPENPLVDGLATELRAKGYRVFGPGQKAAQLEGSKLFSKRFMDKHNIPTAPYQEVTSVSDVKAVMGQFTPPFVFKADGLAGGKGVFICQTPEELEQVAERIFEEGHLGSAGKTALLEQFQPGFELSFFILTNGKSYAALPMAQDHKRLKDGGEGPNTGGMGTVAPMTISPELRQQIIEKVVEPTVQGLSKDAMDYLGVVFIGLMMTDQGPQVLEYNVRFGDPETQVLLPLLQGDWGQVFNQVAQGEVPELTWSNEATACVVLAAEGYPESSVKGSNIDGDLSGDSQSYFLHAGTGLQDEQWVVNGGRVLNAIGRGDNLAQALERAYQQSEKVSWPGLQKRRDIGAQAKS